MCVGACVYEGIYLSMYKYVNIRIYDYFRQWDITKIGPPPQIFWHFSMRNDSKVTFSDNGTMRE